MRFCDPGEVHGHVAHDAFDYIGAEAVLSREHVALGGREPILGNAREVVAGRDHVLHKTLRHPADGARAQADQRFGRIIGVALEISAQAAVPLRDGKFVRRESEVVEADANVARIDERLRDRFRLPMPFGAVGKRGFVDLALVLLCLLYTSPSPRD